MGGGEYELSAVAPTHQLVARTDPHSEIRSLVCVGIRMTGQVL